MTIGTIYSHGYGKNTTAFSTLTPSPVASAEFVVENKTVVGFGVSALYGIKREGPLAVEQTSDVWFVKVA